MASDIKWIKLACDIFDNRKIKIIESMPDGDAILVIWLKLLCLAGQCNDCGSIYVTKDIPYTDQTLAVAFNRPLSSVQMALELFQRFGMIDIVDNFILLPNWEKYQSANRLEVIRDQTRKRVASYRERQKLLCNVTSNADVTQSNATELELEQELELDNKNNNRANRKRFTPPTLEEVKQYCSERGNKVNAEEWFDYYSMCDFKVGKNKKMSDWKASVRYWERNEYGHSKSGTSAVQQSRDWGVVAGVRRGMESEDL